MAESPSKKSKTEASRWWAVFYLAEEPVVKVVFIPYADLEIDLEGNVWAQTRDQIEALYKQNGYDSYQHLDVVQDAKAVAQRFMEDKCVVIAYGCE